MIKRHVHLPLKLCGTPSGIFISLLYIFRHFWKRANPYESCFFVLMEHDGTCISCSFKKTRTNEGTTRFLVEKAAAVFFGCFIDWGFHEPLERSSPVGPPNPVWCQDTIKRFGGPSAPSAPWPREHAAQEEAKMWVERWGMGFHGSGGKHGWVEI